ncbi:MAG: hypothetical protein ABII64_08580 [Elusimicrobiota bacterium]
MKEIIFSAILTLFLGPGVGHLYLKRWKKGTMFIAAALGLLILLAWRFITSIKREAWDSIMALSQQDLMTQQLTEMYNNFTQSYSSFIFYYDLIFAGIWAYALIDGFIIARSLMPSRKQNDPSDNT